MTTCAPSSSRTTFLSMLERRAAPWRNFAPGVAFWFRVAWVVWWAVAPLLQARRQAEAVLSEPPVRFVFSPAGVEMIRLDVSMQIAWPGIRSEEHTSELQSQSNLV